MLKSLNDAGYPDHGWDTITLGDYWHRRNNPKPLPAATPPKAAPVHGPEVPATPVDVLQQRRLAALNQDAWNAVCDAAEALWAINTATFYGNVARNSDATDMDQAARRAVLQVAHDHGGYSWADITAIIGLVDHTSPYAYARKADPDLVRELTAELEAAE